MPWPNIPTASHAPLNLVIFSGDSIPPLQPFQKKTNSLGTAAKDRLRHGDHRDMRPRYTRGSSQSPFCVESGSTFGRAAPQEADCRAWETEIRHLRLDTSDSLSLCINTLQFFRTSRTGDCKRSISHNPQVLVSRERRSCHSMSLMIVTFRSRYQEAGIATVDMELLPLLFPIIFAGRSEKSRRTIASDGLLHSLYRLRTIS
ncbi:hypothetical protein BCR34DRAFT_86643 [Clohesyomyces aquaticus]|uniref:Uncharacterized protein n=1 Tax=Clohesyomyces aquaticus TaxID=1231657 RepID=A0A1Y2A2Y2_9PLEO|nr:hypothetical protein BCR34DRAFT_86643 [Clohesyomyces aquaticus]